MTTNDITLSPLAFNGVPIRDKNEMLSLTDMWKASGSPENREPFNWARFEGKAFVEAVALSHNLSDAQVMTVKRGKGGGTLAHWQIGLAYAKYLSPEFHMWCNTVVRERMEGKAVPAIPADVLTQIERSFGIMRMLAHKVTEMEKMTEAIPALVAAVGQLAAIVQPANPNFLVRHGKTAGQIWHAYGLPPIKTTCWFGNRLAKMGCQIDGSARGEMGLTRARLFDPDKAETWLKNGGMALVKDYISQRVGQKKLRLVGGRS